MKYTLSWFAVSQKPSESALFHEIYAGSLELAELLALTWWNNQVYCALLPVEEFIVHHNNCYASLSDEHGIIRAFLMGLPFRWEEASSGGGDSV